MAWHLKIHAYLRQHGCRENKVSSRMTIKEYFKKLRISKL